MSEIWASPDGTVEAARILGEAFDCLGTLFVFARDMSDVGAISTAGRDARLYEPQVHAEIKRIRRFGAARSSDRHANRVVSTETLYAGDRRVLLRDRKEVFSQFGVGWQMRASVYDADGLVGLVAVCRSMSAGDFEPRDCADLAALLPVLLDGLSSRARLATDAITTGDALGWLDELLEGVYVLTARGTVAWANAAARACDAAPAWLASAARGDRTGAPVGVRLRSVQLGGAPHTVVLCPPPGPAALPCTLALPPRYAHIAGRIAAGQSDKEIASATGLSLATVRTYVAEIYRRAGVRNRVELARRVLGHD